MDFTNPNLRTTDGHAFKILSTALQGDKPVAIEVNGEVARLDSNGKCDANEGYSLVDGARREHVRFFNAYRNADGSFSFGTKACKSNEERLELQDSQRAIFAVKIRVVNDQVVEFSNV